MALILSPYMCRALTESVMAQLTDWGETPRSVSVFDGGAKIGLGFEIISDEPKWRRQVEVVPEQCKASLVFDQLNAWRESVREQLHRGEPSAAVRQAVECFGIEAVEKALEHRGHG